MKLTQTVFLFVALFAVAARAADEADNDADLLEGALEEQDLAELFELDGDEQDEDEEYDGDDEDNEEEPAPAAGATPAAGAASDAPKTETPAQNPVKANEEKEFNNNNTAVDFKNKAIPELEDMEKELKEQLKNVTARIEELKKNEASAVATFASIAGAAAAAMLFL
ncbi:MAG: hypothetical protein SGCHY_005452 [Lobulomycetales sp.]